MYHKINRTRLYGCRRIYTCGGNQKWMANGHKLDEGGVFRDVFNNGNNAGTNQGHIGGGKSVTFRGGGISDKYGRNRSKYEGGIGSK